jgi:hypothetical protein
MSTPDSNTTLPSPETLAHAARQVGDAYPGLYAHQRAGVAFLLSRRRAILADDMGLGKSPSLLILESFRGMQSDSSMGWQDYLTEGMDSARPDQQVVHDQSTENEYVDPVLCEDGFTSAQQEWHW